MTVPTSTVATLISVPVIAARTIRCPRWREPMSCSSPSAAPPDCARPTPSSPARCAARARRWPRRGRAGSREWRTFALIELAWAVSARRGRGGRDRRPRAAGGAVLLDHRGAARAGAGAIRFDAPAAGNRPGRHGALAAPRRAPPARGRAAARAVERGRARRGAPAARSRRRRPGAGAAVRPAGGPRPRGGHLRRQPGEEGARPRARRLARGAAGGRDARRRRAGRARRARRPLRRDAAAGRVPRAAAPRARRSSARRGARTTGSRSSRRSRTAARWSRRRRPGPTPRCRWRGRSIRGWWETTSRGRVRAALDEPARRLCRAGGCRAGAVAAVGGRPGRRGGAVAAAARDEPRLVRGWGSVRGVLRRVVREVLGYEALLVPVGGSGAPALASGALAQRRELLPRPRVGHVVGLEPRAPGGRDARSA